MGLRSCLLLTIVLLVILLRGNGGAINNCLIPHGTNNCSCCKSGYRGPTCSDVCQHCLTHNVPGGNCTYYCETGYYGKTCDKECPHTCADGINGPNHCIEKNGLPECVKCIPRYYGKQCDQMCDTNCQGRICYPITGKCLWCSDNEFYGDHCRLPCNQGCVSGRCNRTGYCTDGCKFGFYGERCEYQCGINCQHGMCTSHEYHPYNCTEGCHGGYGGTSCLEKCPNHCTECEQQSGRCTLCVENYIQKPETGKCVKVTVKEEIPAVADGSNLGITAIVMIVLIVLIVLIVVIIISGIIIVVIYKKRRHCQHYLVERHEEESGSFLPLNQQDGSALSKNDITTLSILIPQSATDEVKEGGQMRSAMDELQKVLLISKQTDVSTAVLKRNLQEDGYQFRDVTPGDGNCFFHAIVDQIHRVKDDIEDNHDKLRQRVVAHLDGTRHQNDGTDRFSFVEGYQSWKVYIQKMKKDGAWVDHLVVMATAEYLGREIWVYTSSPDGEKCENNFHKIRSPRCCRQNPLLVAHYHESHYQSIEKQEVESKRERDVIATSPGTDMLQPKESIQRRVPYLVKHFERSAGKKPAVGAEKETNLPVNVRGKVPKDRTFYDIRHEQ